MKTKSILISLVTIPFLINCGGGGGSTTTTPIPSATINGTVPGTKIEAFCDMGIHKVISSTQNGTTQHPFILEVPQKTNCRLVMTTNENDPDNKIITILDLIVKTGV